MNRPCKGCRKACEGGPDKVRRARGLTGRKKNRIPCVKSPVPSLNLEGSMVTIAFHYDVFHFDVFHLENISRTLSNDFQWKAS